MTKKRFEYGKGDKGPMIYDNAGVDDYYFINDSEELKKFVDSLNDSENTWKENYNHVMGEYKKQLIQINEKDLQISELKKENHKLQQFHDKVFQLLDEKLEETFNNRIKNDDEDSLMEYYKGKHEMVGELRKELRE